MWSRLNQALSLLKTAVAWVVHKDEASTNNFLEEMFTSFVIRPTKYRTVLAWERPLSVLHTSFSLYRGTTDHWERALPVTSPIFCLLDQQRQRIEYHCLDQLSEESEEIYYWLVAKDSNHHEVFHGPYIMQTYKVICLSETA